MCSRSAAVRVDDFLDRGGDEVLGVRTTRFSSASASSFWAIDQRGDVHDSSVDFWSARERLQPRVERGEAVAAPQRLESVRIKVFTPFTAATERQREVVDAASRGSLSRRHCDRERGRRVERSVLALHADVEEAGVVPRVDGERFVAVPAVDETASRLAVCAAVNARGSAGLKLAHADG